MGFIEGVNLFVSPAGKAHGWMLETISALYDIQSHLGDNYYHSDVVMAHKRNVPGIHSTILGGDISLPRQRWFFTENATQKPIADRLRLFIPIYLTGRLG